MPTVHSWVGPLFWPFAYSDLYDCARHKQKFCPLTDLTLEYHKHRSEVCRRCARAGVAMWSRSLALALLLLPAPALAGVKENVAALAPQGLVLVMDAKGNESVAQNTDEPFVPASVTKIVTAWLAMEVLGSDYRVTTRFYLDDKRVFYVRGGGDPFLISEELAPLATELVAAGGKQANTGHRPGAGHQPSSPRRPG